MTTKRMKAAEVRAGWRDVLDHVRAGGEVIVEHYNRPVARIVPFEEPAEDLPEPREIDVDPATIVRMDDREERDPATGTVRQRMTVGTAPDGTPVLLVEAPAPTDYPTGDGWPKLAERPRHKVWAFNSLAAAREWRDNEIPRG